VADLERELRDLGAAVAFPPVPDVAVRVVACLPERSGRDRRRMVALAFAALVVAAVVAVLAVPQARTAVLDWLGLRGATVERVDTIPKAPVVPDELGVGDEVTLAAAAALAGFPLRDPAAAGLGEPDEIRFTDDIGDGQIAYLWRGADGEIETLLTVFRASVELGFIRKLAAGDSPVEQVEVEGERGIWVGGEPHFFVYRGASGEPREETARLAGPTLLWEDGPLLYRLEGDFTKAEALQIARALG
jgi:hypothetical protein